MRQALFDSEVILFHPQTITPPQHVALAQVFVPLSGGSYFDRKPGAPEMEMIVSDRERPPQIDNWHTDISWKPQPPLGTAIQVTVTPPSGGNTCWTSTSKAYGWMSPGMQQYLQSRAPFTPGSSRVSAKPWESGVKRHWWGSFELSNRCFTRW